MTENDSTLTAPFLPVLPLRDVVVFPGAMMSLFVGRKASMLAIEQAVSEDQPIILLTQKNPKQEQPTPEDVYGVGVVAQVVQASKLKDGTYKLVVEGLYRAQVNVLSKSSQALWVGDYRALQSNEVDAVLIAQHARVLKEDLIQFAKINKRISSDLLTSLDEDKASERWADLVAMALDLPLAAKQAILEELDVLTRFQAVIRHVHVLLEQAQLDQKLNALVKEKMDKTQRDFFLNEKMRQIRKELDQEESEGLDDLQEYRAKIHLAEMPFSIRTKADLELKKLRMMGAGSSEASVIRGYLDWLVGVPWQQRAKVIKNLAKAKAQLDADHYGLEKIKERILEFLAIQHKVNQVKGPILCLVGPPGVGKTSLAESIAKSTGRPYVRMALGGLRDEAEIRGHRRTYLGAMPGKIIQRMAHVGVKNPLFLLDEIDKISKDYRGDPASALLEVLDPEQNKAFHDHYLDVDYDLSEVMFVATSNTLDMPEPLKDRMEIIRLSGYTENEKLAIAQEHLLPKSLKDSGLKKHELVLDDAAMLQVIRAYTREAGVRELARMLMKIARKVVKAALLKEKKLPVHVHVSDLESYLGAEIYRFGVAGQKPLVGKVTGLAWTQLGGELLTIEAVKMPGNGQLKLTGKLGEVMQESVQAAWTWVRSHTEALGLAQDFYQTMDVHVHVPEGATPKDGPSAGIAMVTALVSLVTEAPVKNTLAMTGEITLLGEVLPIGGLKEKLLAAVRGGIDTVLIPIGNQKDLQDLPQEIIKNLHIYPVGWVDEVLKYGLEYSPQTEGMALFKPSADVLVGEVTKMH
jgi:ATP-dependent Lon protease